MKKIILKKIDNNSKIVKRFRTSGIRFFMVFFDITILAFAPIILIFIFYGEYAMNTNTLLMYLCFIMLYAMISFGIAIFDFFVAKEINGTVIVKQDDSIFILQTDFVTYEIGLKKEKMTDEEIYKYSIENRNKIPTDEEIETVLEERPEGFSVIEYKDCRLIRETKKYYKFAGVKDGVLSKFKVYKVYSNVSSIVEGGKII